MSRRSMSRRSRRTRKGGWPKWMTGSTQTNQPGSTQTNQPGSTQTNQPGYTQTNDPRNRNTQGKSSMFGNLLNTFTQPNSPYDYDDGARNSYDTSGQNQFGYNPFKNSQGNSSMFGNLLGALTGNANGGGRRRRRSRRSRR